MTLKQIASLGRELTRFLALFASCFVRSEGRNLLNVYVRGQLSDVHRKNCEAIALAFGKSPRTLQRFLESIKWNHEKLRDQCQCLIAKEHAHPHAVGCLDESGTAKSGLDTVGAARQYNGNRGKIEVCTVAVHLSYYVPGLQVLLDSQLYLPKDWANDPVRRFENHVPEEIVFLTKAQIGLQLIQHSIANGIKVEYWTFDELYGHDGVFLDGLEDHGLSFVGEVPKNTQGWLVKPKVFKPRKKRPGRGRREVRRRIEKRRPSCEVQNLAKYSPVFRDKNWQRYKIKDTSTGPQVWEVKWAPFWRKDAEGFPAKQHCLIVMRNVLTGEMKYFLSNRVPGRKGITLRRLLQVAFSRWSVESVFRESKEELGMDHYECRGWQCVHRHFIVTALSGLFCARMRLKFDHTDGTTADRLTMEQVRSAINVYLATSDLPSPTRNRRIEKELNKQRYYQHRNRQAAVSHKKTKNAKFHSIGIDPDRIKSCVPNLDSPS